QSVALSFHRRKYRRSSPEPDRCANPTEKAVYCIWPGSTAQQPDEEGTKRHGRESAGAHNRGRNLSEHEQNTLGNVGRNRKKQAFDHEDKRQGGEKIVHSAPLTPVAAIRKKPCPLTREFRRPAVVAMTARLVSYLRQAVRSRRLGHHRTLRRRRALQHPAAAAQPAAICLLRH